MRWRRNAAKILKSTINIFRDYKRNLQNVLFVGNLNRCLFQKKRPVNISIKSTVDAGASPAAYARSKQNVISNIFGEQATL